MRLCVSDGSYTKCTYIIDREDNHMYSRTIQVFSLFTLLGSSSIGCPTHPASISARSPPPPLSLRNCLVNDYPFTLFFLICGVMPKLFNIPIILDSFSYDHGMGFTYRFLPLLFLFLYFFFYFLLECWVFIILKWYRNFF